MQQANGNAFSCRRCHPALEIRDYNGLRAHLRAVHHVKQLLDSDVILYESFPGSRYTQPPIQANARPEGDVDEMIRFRDEMVGAVRRAVTENVSAIQVPVPLVNVELGEIHRTLGELRRDLGEMIQNAVKYSVQQTLVENSHRFKLLSTDPQDISAGAQDNGMEVIAADQQSTADIVEAKSNLPVDPPSDDSSDVSLVIDTSNDGKVSVKISPNVGQNRNSNLIVSITG